MTDYCDTCKYLKEQLSRNQVITNCAQQSGSSLELERRAWRQPRRILRVSWVCTEIVATKSRVYYNACVKNWSSDCEENVQLMGIVPQSRRDSENLTTLKHCFILTISADYQQSNLISSWGENRATRVHILASKVSHDIFGTAVYSQQQNVFFLFDEHIGPKTQITQCPSSPSTGELPNSNILGFAN